MYCRELDAILEDTQPLKLPKATSYLPVSHTQERTFYHPRVADRVVLCDGKGNFLIKIGFIYHTETGGIQKTLMNVEDIINVRTMQSMNGLYQYPQYFLHEIYTLIRKAFKDGFLEFQGLQQIDQDMSLFIAYISK